jgi:hypothetical protein
MTQARLRPDDREPPSPAPWIPSGTVWRQEAEAMVAG